MNVIKIEPEDTDHKDRQAHRYSERDEAASKGRFAPESALRSLDVQLPLSSRIDSENRQVRKVPCVDGSGLARAFFTVLQHWSVQPCVRPFDAAHTTAG